MSAPPPSPPPASPRPSLVLNWEDWLPYLEDEDASEAEKRQLIETLWSIVVSFVDLGWHIVPEPPAEETCGQVLDLTAALNAAVVNYVHTPSADLEPGGPEHRTATERGVTEDQST